MQLEHQEKVNERYLNKKKEMIKIQKLQYEKNRRDEEKKTQMELQRINSDELKASKSAKAFNDWLKLKKCKKIKDQENHSLIDRLKNEMVTNEIERDVKSFKKVYIHTKSGYILIFVLPTSLMFFHSVYYFFPLSNLGKD